MSSTTNSPSVIPPTKFETELTKMDQGVQSDIPATTTLMVDGVPQKQAQIHQALQGWLATFKEVQTADQAYRDAVQARRAITVAARTYYKALKAAIKQLLGTKSAVLGNFGIAPDRPVQTTTAKKTQAVAKRAQTRTVRGTKGKKQRAAITVVGQPPVLVGSDGQMQAGAPPVNLPAAPVSLPGSGSANGGGKPSAQ